MRKPQFPVLSSMSEPVAQGHSTWVGLQDHRKVFPEINGRAEPKMTEGAPSGMLIYQGFTCWLMIAITVCIWQTQLDMCSEKLYIWSWIKLDLYNFPFWCLGCHHSLCQWSLCFILYFKERQLFMLKKMEAIKNHIKLISFFLHPLEIYFSYAYVKSRLL